MLQGAAGTGCLGPGSAAPSSRSPGSQRWEVSLVEEVEEIEATVLRLRPPPDWTSAACRTDSGALTELFFSSELVDIARAKSICVGCPLKHDCLEGALARQEACGVWGGELLVDGRIIAHKRPRGRPRKSDSTGVQLSVVS